MVSGGIEVNQFELIILILKAKFDNFPLKSSQTPTLHVLIFGFSNPIIKLIYFVKKMLPLLKADNRFQISIRLQRFIAIVWW